MSPDAVVFALKLAFASAALVVIGVVVVRPIVRMLREKPDMNLMIPDYTSVLEEEEQELQIPDGGDAPDRAEMVQAARSDPRATAVLIQQWLKQRK